MKGIEQVANQWLSVPDLVHAVDERLEGFARVAGRVGGAVVARIALPLGRRIDRGRRRLGTRQCSDAVELEVDRAGRRHGGQRLKRAVRSDRKGWAGDGESLNGMGVVFLDDPERARRASSRSRWGMDVAPLQASVLGTSSKTFGRRRRAGQGGKLIQNQRVNPPNNETGRLSPRLAQQTAYSGHSLDTRELCAWGRARVKPSQSWLRKASARLIYAKTVLGSQVGPGWPLAQHNHVIPSSRPETRELRHCVGYIPSTVSDPDRMDDI